MTRFDRLPLHDFLDRALRAALENPANLHDLLTLILPDLAARLDFARAELIRPTFLLDDWRGRESDLLFLVPLRDVAGPVLVCLMIEHQSRPEPILPLRMLVYAALFWEQQWKEYERGHPPAKGCD
jgi:hypothetical protein